jgi:hypothetical protein
MESKDLIIFEEAKAKAPTIVEEARGKTITTQEDLEAVVFFIQEMKRFEKAVDDQSDTGIKKAYDLHRQLIADKKKLKDPFTEAIKIVTPKVNAYNKEQERIRKAEQDLLQKIERERAESEAEKTRKEAEFLADILGEEAPEQEPVIVREVYIPPTPKVAGSYQVEIWDYEIIDPLLIPEEYKIIDEKKIGGVVRALKGLTNIPGVKVSMRKDTRFKK